MSLPPLVLSGLRLIGWGFKWLWDLLWGEKTPLIVTVGLAVAAALLSPVITERFERQKMRSEYVLGNLKDVNSLIADLYVQVTTINHDVASGKPADPKNITAARDGIAKLNWKLIETAAMLPPHEIAQLQRFQQSVNQVSEGLDGKLDVARCRVLLDRVEVMAGNGALVIRAVGKNVELSGDSRGVMELPALA